MLTRFLGIIFHWSTTFLLRKRHQIGGEAPLTAAFARVCILLKKPSGPKPFTILEFFTPVSLLQRDRLKVTELVVEWLSTLPPTIGVADRSSS